MTATLFNLLLLSVASFDWLFLKAAALSPVIIEHPEDIVVAKNDPVTLRCEAEGDPSPDISWWKDGKPVTTAINGHNTHRLLLPSGSLFFLRAVHSKKEDDGGVYFCQAKNSDGVTRSKNASLTIAVLGYAFRTEPEDQGVEKGDTARLVCAPPKGTPTPTVFWKKNGKFLDVEQDNRLKIEGDGDLVIQDVRDDDEGKYQCMAKNLVGTRSTDKVDLSIQVKPQIVKYPSNTSVNAGEELKLACVVGGRPPPEIRWWRRNGQLPANRIIVTDNSLLTIQNVIPDDEDEYICQAENQVGSVQASAIVRIHSSPIFLVEPTDQKVAEGAPAVLDCIAAGNPTPTLFWMKETDSNILLPGSVNNHFTVTPEGTLRIAIVSAENDSGWYSCAAVSESGSGITRAEVAVAKDNDRPPPILQAGPVNQTLALGSSGSLPCQSTTQEATIMWLKDGIPLDRVDERIHWDEENTLTIKDLRFSDSGLYTCQARSSSGQAVWSASLTVESPNNPDVQFKSMPYFSQFPASPSMPILVNATSTSITVAWDKPHRIGGSPLKGYQLDYFILSAQSHWHTIQDVKQEVYTLSKLAPLSTVLVLVRAVNDHGLSPPSPVSKSLKTLSKVNADGSVDDINSAKAAEKNPTLVRMKLTQRVVELHETVPVTSRKIKLQWEVLSGRSLVEGYHIHIRDMSSREAHYDVVTLAGGNTRSHTLSDLRPNTKYSVFIVPYHNVIKGRPSNMKFVTTKEDVPVSSPENLFVEQFNVSTAILQWTRPSRRGLHGELKGFEIIMQIEKESNQTQTKEQTNFTLDPETTSLLLHNLTEGTKYTFRVAAFNHQGIGPFSPAVSLTVGNAVVSKSDEYGATGQDNPDVVSAGGSNEVSGVDLIVQEVWFVSVLGFMVMLLFMIFVAILCFKRYRGHDKNLGHYDVPVHKVDDISHVNFTDRDHLWFDPNWSKSNNILDGSKSNKDDPMAAMLENNCKNRNATNIFINKLAQYGNDPTVAEYAEVDGLKGLPNPAGKSSLKRPLPPSTQGPYATTTLLETSASNMPPGHHSNTSTGTSFGNVLTPTPIRSNSIGRTSNNEANMNIQNQRKLNNKEDSETNQGMDKGELNLSSTTSSTSGSSSSKRLREPNQPPPPLPPPPAEALLLSYFSSPQPHPRNSRQSSVTDARLYNRSLMNGFSQDGCTGSSPPAPPARGPSSYNGVRAGSFASFGHIYPNDVRVFGQQLHQTNGISHSHYSVPGMFFHAPISSHVGSGYCPPGMQPSPITKSQTEDQYESASVCGFTQMSGPVWLHHQNNHSSAMPSNDQSFIGQDLNGCCEDQGWEWESHGSGDDECPVGGCDDDDNFYASSDYPHAKLASNKSKYQSVNGKSSQSKEGSLNSVKLNQLSTPNTPSMNPGRKRAAFQRPSSVCSTDSNFSSVSTHQMNPIYHNHQQQHKNKKNSHYSESGLGAKRGSSRAPGKRHHHHFKQGPSNNCEIYSTFKPPQISTVQVNGMNSSQLENDDKNVDEHHSLDDQQPENASKATDERLFAQVSQDMSEMVEHLNTIQNDISQLAGRPISLYDNS